MRRLLAGIGWLILAVVLAATIGVIAIDVGFQRDRLLALAAEAAQDALGVEVEIEHATGRASRGLELRGIRIGPEDAPLAEIDRLRAEWRIWRWLRDETLRVDRVAIEGAKISLERDAEGRWRTLDALRETFAPDSETAETSSDASTRPIAVTRATLRDSVLAIRLDPTRDPAATPDLAIADSLTFSIEGEWDELRSEATSSLPFERSALVAELVDASAAGGAVPLLEDARIELTLEGDRSLEARVSARGPDLALDADVAGPLESPGPLHFALEASDLARLTPWLPELAGLDGRGTARGTLEGFSLAGADGFDPATLSGEIAADATLTRLPPIDGRSWPEGEAALRVNGRFDGERVEIETATLRHDAGLRLEVVGTGTPGRIEQGIVTAEVDDLTRWARLIDASSGPSATGAVRARARVSGPVAALRGEASLSGVNLVVAGRPLGDLELSVVRQGEAPADVSLSIDARDAARPDPGDADGAEPSSRRRLTLSARVDPRSRDATFEATADGRFLAQVAPELVPVRGSYALEGDAAMETTGLDFDVRLRGTQVVVDEQPLGDITLAARSRTPATRERVALEVAAFRVDGAQGRLALAAPARLDYGPGAAWSIAGLAIDIDVDGEPDAGARTDANTDANTDAGADDADREETRPESLAAGASDSERLAEGGSSSERRPPARIRLDAAGHGAMPDRVELAGDALALGDLTRLMEQPLPLGGRVSFETTLVRDGARFETTGQGQIDQPSFGRQTFDAMSVEWQSAPEGVNAQVTLSMPRSTPLALEAQLPPIAADASGSWRAAWEQAAFVARLDGFDLALLAPFLPRTLRDPGGRVSGRIERKQGPGGARLDGAFQLTDAGITVPLLRRRFTPISGVATLRDERLVLSELRLGQPGKGATLRGELRLDSEDETPIEAVIHFDQLPISRSAVLHADVDGRVEVGGTLSTPRITGSLTLPGVRVRVPAAEDPVLREIRLSANGGQTELVERTATSSDFVTSSYLDVTLEVPDDARIRGQGVHLYVEGRARLSSKPGEPLRVFGEAEVVNGTYTLQGRRFRVRRGSVRLVGDREIDPVLDIEAHYPVDDITAIVDISGRLSAPIIRLSSEPSRSEQDVLSYLLFGRPADEIGGAQGGSMDAAAARLFAGVAERELREVLGDAMPVDSIEIGADDEGNTSELGFGKYLRPNLYLRYVHVLGDEPADRLGVEYRVNDLFSVGSSVSTTGDAGLDLILRHDF